MIKRLIPVVLLILVMIAGCSRKPDEELPARIGDLQVLCKIVDQANLPDSFPVTVSVYSDTAHARLTGTKTFSTMKDSVNTVVFTDLPSNFMYVHITVDVPLLSSRSRETDLTVYVKLNSVTVTPIQVLTVRPGYGDLQVLCKIDDQANLPEAFPVTVSVYSDVARTLLAGAMTFATMKDSINTVTFTGLPVSFMYVHITVNVPSLSSASRETDLTVYIKLESVTVTPIQVLTVRPGYGDLQVLCRIVDQANLPERFPVTVSVYSDTTRTLLAGTKTFTTMKDSVNTVAFTGLPVSFMYVHITVNVDSLASTSCETDLTVYIKLERLTVTPIRVLTVRPGYIECSDL